MPLVKKPKRAPAAKPAEVESNVWEGLVRKPYDKNSDVLPPLHDTYSVPVNQRYAVATPSHVQSSRDAKIPAKLHKMFDVMDANLSCATPKRQPSCGDWLDGHPDKVQSVQSWEMRHRGFDTQKHVIYVQPLGDFASAKVVPDLNELADFVSRFFHGARVKFLDQLALKYVPCGEDATNENHPKTSVTQREVVVRYDQLYVPNLFSILRLVKSSLPNAFCVVGICMEDLFPDFKWNFVFGKASLDAGIGVFSFARFMTMDTAQLLKRSCYVCVHEISHMFGVSHCALFECLMNGSNSLPESEARAGNLCPLDLKKLYLSIGFDIEERYKALLEFYARYPKVFAKEAEFVQRRLDVAKAIV